MSTRSIVGFDATEPSWAALDVAVRRGDPVLIAHVADSDAGLIGPDYRREAEERAHGLLERALAEIGARYPDAEIEGVLLEGPVAWALARIARPDDILIIGTHKTGFLHGRVLGSRSIEVALLAPCDVLVVPTIDLRFRSGIVAGIADDPGLHDVVDAAARAALARDEELLLLHSTEDGSPESNRELVARANSIAREVAPRLVIRTRASNRHTAELLLDAARDRALLVVGVGSGDRSRSPIGSVLHDLLLNITAPTLVTRPAA
ncbi:universal stress protein [Pseudolysinimonas sp.]|uniref:universal stress protein n=1 Tax=Pseudolysinimonas sp. TaxID=2680009 RepID=UPI0037851102